MICHRCKCLILDSLYSIYIKDENGQSANGTSYVCSDCYHALQRFLNGEDDEDFEDDEWDW